MRARLNRIRHVALAAVLVAPVAACHSDDNTKDRDEVGAIVPLAVVGFNYTDKEIDSFFIDGVGGGNVSPSTLRGGGGGTVCCANYAIGVPAWKAEVKWQFDACKYNMYPKDRKPRFGTIHRFFRTDIIEVDKKIPKRPRFLEVHFYPDNHIEVAITENPSRPRLALDPLRAKNLPLRQCPDDKEPE